MLAAVLIASICLAVLLSYVWVQAEINEAAAERRSWERALRRAVDEHDFLQFQLWELQSSSRIEQEAVQRLGMTEPSQVIFVNPFFE
jgi:cell division protein FtsL